MLSSGQPQALYTSVTVQQSQVDSLLYLKQLCSDHKEKKQLSIQN